MYRKRNKEKLQDRRREQENYMGNTVPFPPTKRVAEAIKTTRTTTLPTPQQADKQKHNWLEIAMHYLVVLTAIGLALCLAGLEAFMGYNVAFEQAKDPTAQLILADFNVAAATFTFILPHIATRAKAAWLVWGLVCFPYSTYNTYTWMHQNWNDAATAKAERKTDEITALETRYATVSNSANDECHSGKKGSTRGENCTRLEGDAFKLWEQLEAKRKANNQAAVTDPRNTAVVKLLQSVNVEVSLDQVKTVVALLISIIPPCGGLVFKFAVKSIKRED
jgi:hypothetical protein